MTWSKGKPRTEQRRGPRHNRLKGFTLPCPRLDHYYVKRNEPRRGRLVRPGATGLDGSLRLVGKRLLRHPLPLHHLQPHTDKHAMISVHPTCQKSGSVRPRDARPKSKKKGADGFRLGCLLAVANELFSPCLGPALSLPGTLDPSQTGGLLRSQKAAFRTRFCYQYLVACAHIT